MTEQHHSDRSDYAGSTFTGLVQKDINRARQAAEALFAPKPPSTKPSAPTAATADQTARKPRILSAVQARPTRIEPTEVPVASVPPKPSRKIPASHRDRNRIRTWLKYGMTIPQIAKVYGLTTGDIERVLQKA